MVATTPACEDKNAVAVGHVEEFVSIQLAFQPNGIQVHVAYVAKLVFQTLRRFEQHHVGRPAGASNENAFSVHLEKKGILLVYFRSDFPDAKLRFQLIGRGVVHFEFQIKRVKVRCAHLRRPPEVWIGDVKLRKACSGKRDLPRLSRTKLNIFGEMETLDSALQR